MNSVANMATSALMRAKNVTIGMTVEIILMKKDVIFHLATKASSDAQMPYAYLFDGDVMDTPTVQTSLMSETAHLSHAWTRNFSVHLRKNALTSPSFAMESKIVMMALMRRRTAHLASVEHCLVNMAAVRLWKVETASVLQE